MQSNLHHFTRQGNPWQPAFLKQRMDEFYIERWGKQWRGEHIMRGRKPGRDSVQLVSNDYLSVTGHPEIVHAQIDALKKSADSVLMSGIFLHGENPQSRLEQDFADYVGMEAAILSQSGYAANVGLIQAVAREGVPVYIDMIAHASLWEGIQSAGATPRPFRHNDVAHLERQMATYGPGVLCVDSLYSTIGSLCPLREMIAVARQHGCLVVVDESHSLGVFGEGGAGLVAGAGLSEDVDFITASLAKAFAGRAGIVFCRKEFVDYFWFTARPAIFSSCMLPNEIAALAATLEVIRREEWRRKAVASNAEQLRQGLDLLGYNVDASESQIIGIEAGEEWRTQQLRKALEERDVFGSVFCAPATGTRRSLIRLSINAAMTERDIEKVLVAFADVRDEVEMWKWSSTQRKQRQAVPVAI